MRGLAAGLIVLGAVAAACGNDAPPATIDDARFVRQANAACRSTVPGLRPPERGATSTTQLRAENLDRTADQLAALADRLRALPVQASAAAQVDTWLADWDRFVAVGRRYAAAVRADDPETYTSIDDEAVELAERMGRFARGNDIDDCVL